MPTYHLPTCRARTNVVGHSSHPDWQEHFEILVADEVSDISFTVKDDNWIGVSVVNHKAAVVDALLADALPSWTACVSQML